MRVFEMANKIKHDWNWFPKLKLKILINTADAKFSDQSIIEPYMDW